MCRSVDVVQCTPRRCARQLHRNNVPADDPRTYYRRCTSVQLVDHLLVELETIFSPHHRAALLGLCLVPSALVTLPGPDVKSHVAKLVYLYEEDLAYPESVSHQMVSWKIKWQQHIWQSLPPYFTIASSTRQVCTQTYGYCCWCSVHCWGGIHEWGHNL